MKTKRDNQILKICLKIGKIDENKKNLEKQIQFFFEFFKSSASFPDKSFLFVFLNSKKNQNKKKQAEIF